MKDRCSIQNLIHFLPGLVILFFGMLALHSALVLIRAHEHSEAVYKQYGADILALKDAFFEFEIKFYEYAYTQHKEKDMADEVIQKYGALYDVDNRIVYRGNGKMFDPEDEAYQKLLEKLQQQIKHVAVDIVDLRTPLDHPEIGENLLKSPIHEEIDEIHDSIKSLQEHYYKTINALSDSDLIASREQKLYWSVIAIGLSGFILVLLNADKLRQLKKNNEEKLEYLDLMESRLAALEAAQDGIIIIDSTGNLSFANRAMFRLLHIPERQRTSYISGQWDLLFDEDITEAINEEIMPELDEKGCWMGELPFYHDDGSATNVEFSITRLPDHGGMIATAQDMTDRQRAESEKKQLEAQFYQAQKMEAIGRLAGGIAHDFNNILAAVNGYAEFLIDDLEEGSDQRKFAMNIVQAGRQAKDLVDQILAFSRRTGSNMEYLDLITSVQEAVAMLGASLPKTIEVNTDIRVSMAPINANATQMSQLIMNLCVNAKDAMEDESGTLSIGLDQYVADDDFMIRAAITDHLPDPKETPFLRVEDREAGSTHLIVGQLQKGRPYIKLSIEDTGSGMSRAVMEHIFEPFFTTKPVDKGTGLGLATVHGVVIGHGGALYISSTLGKGTTFEIYLPQHEDGILSGVMSEADEKQAVVTVRDARILLVEDQSFVREMIKKLLERLGHRVVLAHDGLEGIQAIRKDDEGFDLVISDQNMPKMTGIQMIEIIHLEKPDLPFILVSGYSESQMQDMIDRHPAIKATLRKPVAKDVLMYEINMVLQDASSHGSRKMA